MSAEKEGFASRWSRLKREGEGIELELEQASEAELAEAAPQEPPDDTLTDEELLEKYELPDPDAMKAGDDFSLFMKKAIPEKLRRRALRRLWLSNPALANLDELVDYGEDFTDAATVVENMSTIYQVGKGSAWKFKEEQARLAALLEDAEDYEAVAETDEPEVVARVAEDAPPADEIADDAEPVAEPQDEESETAAYRPRPMRFSFE